MSSSDESVERDRISRLFQFVRALNELRNPVPRQIRELQWSLSLAELPHHDCVELGAVSIRTDQDAGEADDFVLRVKRPPPLEPVPAPPSEIAEWLEKGWEDYEGSVSVKEVRTRALPDGGIETVRFTDDQSRPLALTLWEAARESFLADNIPALKAFRLFERLYVLYGTLERDAERYDIMLGDGILSWNVPRGSIRFPIVLQKLEIEFDPSVPCFTLTDANSPTELYSALFRTIESVDGSIVGAIKKELDAGQYHPLSAEGLTALLKSIPPRLASNGRYVEQAPAQDTADPCIHRAPIVFLRKRTLGIAEALDRIIADVASGGMLPQSLINIVGEGILAPASMLAESEVSAWTVELLPDVLFTKPANVEQYRIAEAIDSHSCVLVQGPPGTGKTHTIANLLGHLLAEGKSVLVTSSTTKALRVLRDKVVEQLRPLCVSVLESDTESNDQLKTAVESIVERLSSSTESALQRRAGQLTNERTTLLSELRKTKQRLLEGRHQDTKPLMIGTEPYDALEAARIVDRGREQHSWIPKPVLAGSELDLTPEDIRVLYRTNSTVPPNVENELTLHLPKPEDLLQPGEFAVILDEMAQIEAAGVRGREYWKDSEPEESSESTIQAMASALTGILEPWLDAEEWLYSIGHDGLRGTGHVEAWSSLSQSVFRLRELRAESREPLARYGPQLSESVEIDEQRECLSEILLHLRSGGNLRLFSLLLKPRWKSLLSTVKVNGRQPRTEDEINALFLFASIESEREALKARWMRQVGEIGGPLLASEKPEEAAALLIESMRSALEWGDQQLKLIQGGSTAHGFDWARALRDSISPNEDQAEFRAQLRVCRDIVPLALDARLKQLRLRKHRATLQELEVKLKGFSGETSERLLTAVRVRSPEMYDAAFKSLRVLFATFAELRIRRDILARLSQVAPAWADAVVRRLAPHDLDATPGDVRKAWEWAQFSQQLEERDSVPIDDLQCDLHNKTALLERKTADLADARAWLAQRRRTGLAEQQALVGWQQTIKRIGKGTGKRAPVLRKLARDLMDRAKTAVPVWIMPMIRVAENYDPQTTRFDVVIIDEASQSDVTGLLALYYGAQVIVVGDDEQVSPEAVGQRLDETQHLINEYLFGIPNSDLYDGKSSIYDLAKASFGGTICLREHFRCVPDIIQFSNRLSYDEKLIPLREASESSLLPHVVEQRVSGHSYNKINEEDAEEVVALIMSCLEQPEYDGKTIGVISMVGEEQAIAIETSLRRRVAPKVLEARRLLCGNSAQFQGDERDVMFLSLVDSSNGPRLTRRDDPMFKKRFNVAASRARDQMWVVHSMDIGDLAAGDLRRRLIEHAMNPRALQVKIEAATSKAESEFEKDVLRQLIVAGFRVKPQYVIGPYRIDIMVEGHNRRLAVECDGEPFHTILDLQHDMERQSQLERVGLTFHRIRGSRYYRDKRVEIERLLEKLAEMGILPEPSEDVPKVESGELLRRVRDRAAEIKSDYLGESNTEDYRARWPASRRAQASNDRGTVDLMEEQVESSEKSAENAGVDETDHDNGKNTVLANAHEASRSQPNQHNAVSHQKIASELVDFLVANGIPQNLIIDKRDHERGALWVIADESKSDLFQSLETQGIRFTFAPEGGKSTGHLPGWWMRKID